MKRSDRPLLLGGVLLTVALVTAGVSFWEEKKEEIRTTDEVILEVPVDSVTKLSWHLKSSDQTLTFQKLPEDDVWHDAEDDTFPVDEGKLEALLFPFEELRAAFIIEAPEDLSQYGLDDPVGIIRLETEDLSYEIRLGSYSELDDQRYCSIGDGNVYLLPQDPLERYGSSVSTLILNDEIPDFSVETVTAVSFRGTEQDHNYDIIRQEEHGPSYRDSDLYFARMGDELVPLDTVRLTSYLSDLSWLDQSTYVTYNATEADLASFGLDQPELTVTVDFLTENEDGTETPDSFTLHLSRDPGELAEQEQTASEQTDEDVPSSSVTVYGRVGDSKIIYRLDDADYDSLIKASYNDLRHQQIIPMELETIRQLDIALDDTNYTLTAASDDGERLWSYGEEPLTNAEPLEQALSALRADHFVSASEPTDGKLEISLRITPIESDPEPAGEIKPPVTLDFYRYDGSNCLVCMNGIPVAHLPRSQVVDLMEAVHTIVLNADPVPSDPEENA